MRNGRRLGLLWIVALVTGLLAACLKPLTAPPTGIMVQAPEASRLEGTVDFGDRRAQATIDQDVALGATVSLIDVASGTTFASARTDAAGRFVMVLSGFRAPPGAMFYLEAVKGLSNGGGQPNEAGADAARVRTIVTMASGTWKSLTSLIGGRFVIDQTTTAVSVIVSLRQTTDRPIDARTLLGSIYVGTPSDGYPDSFMSPDVDLLPLAMVHQAYNLIADSLSKGRDPLRWIQLDPNDATHSTLRMPDVPFSMTYLSPSAQEVGHTLEVVGVNYDPTPENNRVSFTSDGGGWVAASVATVSADLTRLSVTVPFGAVNGPLRLEIGPKTLVSGFSFQLAVVDGHSAVQQEGGLLYVYAANSGLGTIARISTTGQVAPYVTGLDHPQALTFGAFTGSQPPLYVGCGGATHQILRVDPVTKATSAYGTGTIASPTGMAFARDGGLYVSDASANALYRIASAAGPVTQVALSGVPLAGPRGLSFGSDGVLYVANSTGNNVVAVTLSADGLTGTATEYISGLSRPWSIALDSKGNFYVSNNTGNSIYRRDAATGQVSAFASMPTPGGLDADPSGYIYCADNVSNQVYQINSLGESRQIATGISSPKGIHVDSEGIFVLTGSGQLLRIRQSAVGNEGPGSLSVFADGLTGGDELGRDSAGNFYVLHVARGQVSKITPEGLVSTLLKVPNVDHFYVAGTKLYLKKNNSLDPYGAWSGMEAVEERDLADPALAVTRTVKSHVQDAVGIAYDNSTGPYKDWLYVACYNDASIQRVDPSGRNYPFVATFDGSPPLARPFDVWVNPANGEVWVTDYGNDTNSDGLYVYSSAGARVADLSSLVNRPRRLEWDGQFLYLANQGSGQVLKIDPAARALAVGTNTFSVPSPFAIAFDVASNPKRMFVATQESTRRIVTVSGYDTQSPGAAATYYNINAYDLHWDGTNLFAVSGARYRIAQDATSHEVVTYSRGTAYAMARRTSDGTIWMATREGWLGPWNRDWWYITGAMKNYTGGGAVCVDGLGNWVASTHSSCGGFNTLFGSLTGGFQLENQYDVGYCWVAQTAMTSDGAGKVYLAKNPFCGVLRLDTTTNALVTFANNAYGAGDRSLGLSVYNGTLYQTITSQHKIVTYDTGAPLPAPPTALPYGLVAPEL